MRTLLGHEKKEEERGGKLRVVQLILPCRKRLITIDVNLSVGVEQKARNRNIASRRAKSNKDTSRDGSVDG